MRVIRYVELLNETDRHLYSIERNVNIVFSSFFKINPVAKNSDYNKYLHVSFVSNKIFSYQVSHFISIVHFISTISLNETYLNILLLYKHPERLTIF